MPADALPVAHGEHLIAQGGSRGVSALPVAHGESLIAGIIPAGVTTTTVTFGPYTDANGATQFANMTATITPSAKVTQTATGAVIVPAPIKIALDATGAGAIALANTDAAGLVPSGFTYTLTWQAGRFDATPGNLTFSLPMSSGPTVDFDLIAPVVTSPAPPASLDSLVASLLTDPTSRTSAIYAANLGGFMVTTDASAVDTPTGSALRAAIGPPPRGALTIVIGDSVDAGSDDGSIYSAGSVFSDLCILSGQRMRWLRNSGVGGNRSFEMLARLQADVIAYDPDVCIWGGMTNDIGQKRTDTRANTATAINMLRDAGIHPVVRTTPPCDGQGVHDSLTEARQAVQVHNAWLREWAAKQGIPVLDYYTPVVDEATGGYLAGMSDDGTHPNLRGQLAIAQYILAQGLPAVFNGQPLLTGTVGDGADLFGGAGLFLGALNGDGLPGDWGQYGGDNDSTFATVADPAIPGNWQTMTGGSGPFHVVTRPAARSGFTDGDLIEFACRIRKTGAGLGGVKLILWAGSSQVSTIAPAEGVRVVDGVAVGRARVPVGGDAIAFEASVGPGSTISIAQVTATNLTALGLDS